MLQQRTTVKWLQLQAVLALLELGNQQNKFK
jgi:hypothetical protein